MSQDLAGRTALVTGGSRGLGAEICRGLAEQGANVLVVSRKLEACEQLAAELRSRFDVAATPIAANVGVWEECDRLIDAVLEDHGVPDILVNNAGSSPLYPSLDQVSQALFERTLALNLAGPFRLSAGFGSQMVAQGRGAILNISSLTARAPRPEMLPYAAAKAGLEAITVGCAHAFGPTVRVNAIAAGPFLTDVSRHWDLDAFEREFQERYALQRAGKPEEIVGAAVLLVSDASSYCTGAVLRLDGGAP